VRHPINNFHSVIFTPRSSWCPVTVLCSGAVGRSCPRRLGCGGAGCAVSRRQPRASPGRPQRVAAWPGEIPARGRRSGTRGPAGRRSRIRGSDRRFPGASAAAARQEVIFGSVQWQVCRPALKVSVRAATQGKITQHSTSA